MNTTTQRLRELLQAATPEPWSISDEYNENMSISGIDGPGENGPMLIGEYMWFSDTKLIVEMRNALPALLDRLDKLEARLKAADELAKTALKVHKELEEGYETCGLIVDLKYLALTYRNVGKE